MKPIWDAHVHLFPPEIYKNWERYALLDPWFGALTRKPAGGRGAEEAWCTPEEALEAADQAGVAGLVMQGWYWNDPGLISLHNDFMAQVMADHPGRLLAFAAINPVYGEQAVAEIQRCAALGFAGVGELGPGGNGYSFEDACLLDVLGCAEELRLPVCIHCGEPVGHPYPGRDTTPLEPLVELLGQRPGLTVQLAHLGGGLPFYELNPRIRRNLEQHVYYDLAATPLLYDLRSVKAVIGLVGPERVLYGSDFPLTLYPGQCRTPDFARFVGNLQTKAGLSMAEQDALFHQNLLQMLEKKSFDFF